MKVFKILIYLVLAALGSLNLTAEAGEIQADLKRGITINTKFEPHEIEELKRYASNPEKNQSREILEIVLSKLSKLDEKWDLDFIRKKDVIAFISIDGVNQIVHIRKKSRKLLIMNSDYEIEPDDIKLYGNSIITIWIVDNIDFYATSVSVNISKQTRSLRLTSFESPILTDEFFSPDSNKIAEIGLKYFDISTPRGFEPLFTPKASNIDITFIRRDLDTYEQRTWSRSYQEYGFNPFFCKFDLGVFAPLSDTKIKRYSAASGQITEDNIEKLAFLTFSISPNLDTFPNTILVKLFPSLILGIGYPMNLFKNNKNAYMTGFGWRLSSDLLKLSIGCVYEDKLKSEYHVGDNVAAGTDILDSISSTKYVIGVTVSLSVIGKIAD